MKRFRIHLSTAICLMLVASVLLWLNVRDNAVLLFDQYPLVGRFGWPSRIQFNSFYMDSQEAATSPEISYFKWSAVVIDALVAGAILLTCGFVFEWRIRRREAKPQ